jgi:hypothetical protein
VRVCLTKKLSLFINGVDLRSRNVGEVFDCADESARMLVLEGWAEYVDPPPPTLSETDPGVFVFEQPTLPFWLVIDSHRNGKKEKLSSSS